MSLPHTRFDVSNMAGVLQEAETVYSSGAPESTPDFLVCSMLFWFQFFSFVFVLFLSHPCCSVKFINDCRFPFAQNIPFVFLYFTYMQISKLSYFQILFEYFMIDKISIKCMIDKNSFFLNSGIAYTLCSYLKVILSSLQRTTSARQKQHKHNNKN